MIGNTHGFDLTAPISRRAVLGRPSLLLVAAAPGILAARRLVPATEDDRAGR